MSKKGYSLLSGFLGVILLTVVDQFTKYLAFTRLRGQENWILIPGVFELEYVENRGAAFGILKDSRWIFMAGSILIFCILIWLYYKTPLTKKYQPVRILTTFLGAGAVGNMIDRVFRGYVIDFFYFSLIDFPVFNVADIYVVCPFWYWSIYFWLYIRRKILTFSKRGRRKHEYRGFENETGIHGTAG